ncbi:MAG: hypothetical protein K7J15_04560 [Candidatus Regiella insecticola]|nr:hypothetical protein [Candidatus Regiella insecticola]
MLGNWLRNRDYRFSWQRLHSTFYLSLFLFLFLFLPANLYFSWLL